MNRSIFLPLAWAGGLALTAALSSSEAQGPVAGQKRGDKGLDRQSLQALDRELLSGLPDARPNALSGAESAGKEKSLSPLQPPEPNNPLLSVAERMRSVAGRMAEHDTSSATQAQQQRIVADLDALLRQAQKSPQPGSSQVKRQGASTQNGTGTGNAAAGPPRDSTSRIEAGASDRTEPADVKDLLRHFWGHLPDRLREPMQASLPDQFLPKYEHIIEQYYKRLAEERPPGP